jgi:hypothetical protein
MNETDNRVLATILLLFGFPILLVGLFTTVGVQGLSVVEECLPVDVFKAVFEAGECQYSLRSRAIATVIGGGLVLTGVARLTESPQGSVSEDEREMNPEIPKPASPAAIDQPVASSDGAVSSLGGRAEKLVQLADLHARGMLTDEEFLAAKSLLPPTSPS